MLVEIVQVSVFWLNTFPPDDDVLDTLSPRDLIVGRKIDFNKHCRIEYGTYAQVHEDHGNTMDTRAVGAIALRPTGNAQGGYLFFSLATGRRLNRNSWTELPMPKDVINRVHKLARRSKANRDLLFAWRDGTLIADDFENDDDEDDLDWDPDDNAEANNAADDDILGAHDDSEHTDDDDDGDEDDLYLPGAIDMPIDMPIAGGLDENVNENNVNENQIPNENRVVNENHAAC
jgi:hypothetical protein